MLSRSSLECPKIPVLLFEKWLLIAEIPQVLWSRKTSYLKLNETCVTHLSEYYFYFSEYFLFMYKLTKTIFQYFTQKIICSFFVLIFALG